MATLRLEGLDELLHDLVSAAELPAEDMLNAGADIAVAAQKSTGEKMGVHRTGTMLGSLKKFKVVHASSGAYIKIGFTGTNPGGARNVEVAFINEYGKTNQPARPFIAVANEESAGDIAVAEYKVFDNHLSKHNL